MTKYSATAVTATLCALFLAGIHLINGNKTIDAPQESTLKTDRLQVIAIPERFGPLPSPYDKLRGAQLFAGPNWEVYRIFPSGQLEILQRDRSGHRVRAPLNDHWRRDAHPLFLGERDGRLYVAAYDVVKNIPSGRRLSTAQPGIDVHVIDSASSDGLQTIASSVDIGAGIDSLVHGYLTPGGITLCANNKCFDVSQTGKIRLWNLGTLKGYEFIEVALKNNDGFALIRRKWDDRFNGPPDAAASEYFLASIRPNGAEINPLAGNGIPFDLRVKEGKPFLQWADSPSALKTLFLYELDRMKHGGLIDLGENNLEGRVAWSQTYYLHGLITAHATYNNLLNPAEKSTLADRISTEIDLIGELALSDYPGYRVKRYSMDREPLLFALHLGRVGGVLARAADHGFTTKATSQALRVIQQELESLRLTVEELGPCRPSSSLPLCITLLYRQGYPFWADGINVPYNYISGYVDGLLAINPTPTNVGTAESLMKPLLKNEKISTQPSTWRYWWGEGQTGWSEIDGFSINTRTWNGNAAGVDLAHISYRSMDATALLHLHQKTGEYLSHPEIQHIKSLVESGMLLPQVNERLILMNQRAILSQHAAQRHARASQAWEIQSQIWALSDLANHYETKQ